MPRSVERLARYRTWLFDCDGVLLDSNGAKTAAFRHVGMRYGPDAAEQLVLHHVAHGGVSRFAKVEHLFSGILRRRPATGEFDHALRLFADAVRDRMATVAIEPSIDELLTRIGSCGASAYVVSGSEHHELQQVLKERGVAHHFDGIFGSPQTKKDIIADLAACGRLRHPAVFVGDSRLDFVAAQQARADFVFVQQWSELADWRDALPVDEIVIVDALSDLLDAWH